MRATHCGDDPRERPAVRVEHRQCPKISICRGHWPVRERADRVYPSVTMRDHYTLRMRRRTAGVVDGEQIRLLDRWSGEFPIASGEQRFVVEPSGSTTFERDEVLDADHAIAHSI